MTQQFQETILKRLIQELVSINKERLKVIYEPPYETRNNKSLAATRLKTLAKQEAL